MRCCFFAVLCLLVHPLSTYAEVTNVTVTSRAIVAGGQAFGSTGPYEKLVGRIEFALDPADPHNARIVDLEHARRGADGRVRFSSDLFVLRPSDPTKGNGVLFFEIANRGGMGQLDRFNRGGGGNDPTTPADFGDGLLMRDGYTLVWVGWEIDVPAPLLRLDAPPAMLPSGPTVDPLSVELMYNERTTEAFLIDDPAGRPPVIYPPAALLSRAASRRTLGGSRTHRMNRVGSKCTSARFRRRMNNGKSPSLVAPSRNGGAMARNSSTSRPNGD